MIDEQKQDNTQTQHDGATGGETPERLREHPAFLAVKEQAVKERQAREALEARLAEIEASETQRKKAAEQAELEAKGNYEEALNRLRAESEAKEREWKMQLTEQQIRAEMARVGGVDELLIRGAVAGYTEGDVAEYVAALREKNPRLFAEQGITRASSPAQGSSSGAKTMPSIDEVKAWEASDDKDKRARAREFLAAYRREHGAYPY